MNTPELLQQLQLGATIELFKISTLNIGGTDVFYFHAGTNDVLGEIVWQGVVYNPWPVQAEGFDLSNKGVLPRPHLRLANVTRSISAVNIALDDLLGCEVTRKRTFAQYLDGQPGADPSQGLVDDIYFVERKVMENKNMVEYELASALDLEGVQLPSRDINANQCPWGYRSAECSYTGTAYFDAHDQPTDAAHDVCSKSVTGCKKRFGVTAILPFGGFPAARAYRY